MLVSLIGRGPWTGLLVGLVAGFSFWAIHISWITLYLGPVPWLALAGLETIFFGVGLSLVAVVLRWGHTVWPTPLGRLGMVPVVVAGLWTAREGSPRSGRMAGSRGAELRCRNRRARLTRSSPGSACPA